MKLRILLMSTMLMSIMTVNAQTDTVAVLRIGGLNGTNGTSGTTTPGTSGSPMHIDKYLVSGGAFTYISSIDLPTKSPTNNTDTICASSSNSEGYIVQSANKQWMSVMGYTKKTTGGTIYTNVGQPRTLGLINYDGSFDLSTKLSNFPYTNTPTAATAQTAITNDGTNFWCVTAQGSGTMGVLYTQPGSLDATVAPSAIVTTATPTYNSIRSLAIFGGDLYWCAASLNRVGLVSSTGGLPTVAGSSNLTPISIASGSTPINNIGASQIVMFDLDSSIIGYDVMYVTNTSTTAGFGGIYKYSKNAAGKWVSNGTYGAPSAEGLYFGITGRVINGLPVLYVTRGFNGAGTFAANQLLQLTEAAGYNATINLTLTASTDATVAMNGGVALNGTLRGISFYASASSFYYKGTGNLNDVTNWGLNTNGSGTAPLDFTTDGQIFFINNGASATLSGNWTVSGIDSKIILGDGTNATSLTIPTTNTINGEMDVYNNATLNIQNLQPPHLHYVAANSTVNFAAASAQNIRPMAFGNFSNTNNSSASINGTITVVGNFVQSGLLKGNDTLVVVKNGLTNTGTMAPGNSPGNINVKGNFANASSGILNMELGGNTQAGIDYDLLRVDTGTVALDGTLNIQLYNSFAPTVGQTYTIITDTTGTAASTNAISGTFATVNWPSGITGTVTYNPYSVVLTITGALPLNLLSFTGSVLQSGKNQLQWKTANEKNVDHFSVERSDDGTNFSSLLNQPAKDKVDNRYLVLDENPSNGLNFYRLKIVDRDGKFTYSSILSLKNNGVTSFTISPNPAKNNLIVTYPAGDQHSFIRLVQGDGKVVFTQTISVGSVQSTLDISKLTPGLYYVIVNSGKATNTFKLVKE